MPPRHRSVKKTGGKKAAKKAVKKAVKEAVKKACKPCDKSAPTPAEKASTTNKLKAKVNPVLKPIDLKPFRNPAAQNLLHPTREWHLDWVEPFCDLQFNSGLGFTEEDRKRYTSEEMLEFAYCPAVRDDIVEGTWELEMWYTKNWCDGLVHREVGSTFEKLQEVLRQHATREKGLEVVSKSAMGNSALAHRLASLCGFDGARFTVTHRSTAFEFAGEKVNRNGAVYAAKRIGEGAHQLVLLWEDKLSVDSSGDDNPTEELLRASAAQIIGQMISVHYQNVVERKCEPCTVYAIRLIDDMVAFFKMEMTAEQVEAVCVKGVIPNSKLKV